MKQVILNEQHIKELNNFIQDLPVKFGLPLLNFLNKVIQEAAIETGKEEESKVATKTKK